MNQQCSSTSDQMFKVSASGPNAGPQPNSPLINRLINDCLLDA